MKFKQKRDSFRMLAAASLTAIALSSTSALAQAQSTAPVADNETVGLEEIIVQARKVNENLQDVPVAVTAFTGESLEAQGAVRVQDIANFTPGLYIRSGSNSPAGITVALRGQFQNDTLATLDPSVGTYVDGVYWARAYGLNTTLLDISSVQVLKGPQGTLFGRNTTGGAMLINSNDPRLGEFSGKLSASYGRFNEFEPTAVVNIPIGDKIAVRFAGKRFSRDGYTTNSVPPGTASAVTPVTTAVARRPVGGNLDGLKVDNRDRWQARGKLLIQPTDNLSLIFSGEYFKMDEAAPSRNLVYTTRTFNGANSTYNTASTSGTYVGILNGNPPASATAPGLAILATEAARLADGGRITANNEIPYVYAKTQTYNFTGALDTSFGQIKLITSYRKVAANAGFDLDGSAYALHFTESQQVLKQQSAELQFTGKAFGDAVDFAAGAFAFHESGFDQSISITVPILNPVTSHFWGKIDNDSIGMYGQATWHLNDKLSFTGGLRYSVDDKGLETRSNNFNRTSGVTTCAVVAGVPAFTAGEIIDPVQCAFKRRDSFSGWSYTASVDYKISDDILVYAKTAKGFRSGGQNLRAPNTASFIPFAPEIAYSYEVGFKSEFLDNRVRLNVAAYTSDVNDIQRSTLVSVPPVPPATVPGTATLLGNAGKVRIRGLEAELTAVLFEGFTVQASGALVDPKYIRYADLTGDRSFERFSGVFKKQYSLAADYTTALGSDARIKLHADYSWRSKVPLDIYNYTPNPENDAIIAATTGPSLGLVGARAAVEFLDRFEIGVFVRNLTNEREFAQNQLVAPVGYISATYNEPRTYGVTASFEF
ncbi:MAG: TonB-dependent receptor [Sphingopyxis sp.]|nr:TonB-dependent receptor [Sphingopyxis sp.]